MHAIIGTQSIGLINRDISRAILANCNTYLSLSCASDEDSRIFADTFGTYKRYETATHIKTDVQEVTGITSKQVEDYIVSPQDIKNIIPGSGMGYLYRKAAGRKPVKVKVYKKF
jgi:type IV secretory pathway TraG/TraD family ATPase VirD4